MDDFFQVILAVHKLMGCSVSDKSVSLLAERLIKSVKQANKDDHNVEDTTEHIKKNAFITYFTRVIVSF